MWAGSLGLVAGFVGILARLSTRYGSRVPSTEETAADPVADSSVPDVARSTTDAQR